MKFKDTNIFLSILVLALLDLVVTDDPINESVKVLTKLKEKHKNNENSSLGSANELIGISNDSKESYPEHVKSVIFRVPFSLTRLAKSPNYGYDPYFRKEDFEPFERRNKLITLLAFRKKQILPRALVTESEQDPLDEVAEMQSPYNTVGQFWEDTLTAS